MLANAPRLLVFYLEVPKLVFVLSNAPRLSVSSWGFPDLISLVC